YCQQAHKRTNKWLMFICDRTLGRLSKWLRILGFETLFLGTTDDEELISKSTDMKDAIFITRNIKLFSKVQYADKLLVKSTDFREQLKEVSEFFPDNWKNYLFTRCTICGAPLVIVSIQEVKESVPDYICETIKELKKCPLCDKIYWRGTHFRKITVELKSLFPEKID
ncbi:Mut7-C RNAse domain-containing protein, partial [bacterium]|nr:Mut7-C RNAse domain-containing protein [bacterium]